MLKDWDLKAKVIAELQVAQEKMLKLACRLHVCDAGGGLQLYV